MLATLSWLRKTARLSGKAGWQDELAGWLGWWAGLGDRQDRVVSRLGWLAGLGSWQGGILLAGWDGWQGCRWGMDL